MPVMKKAAAHLPMNKALAIHETADGSLILLGDGTWQSDSRKPRALFEAVCLEHGSSMEGRMESFRHVLNVRQKAAVLISELSGEIWFPTVSMKSSDCVWLCFAEILEVKGTGPQTCSVTFFSGITIDLDIDRRTIRLQMKRCRDYLEKLSLAYETHDTPVSFFYACMYFKARCGFQNVHDMNEKNPREYPEIRKITL